VVRKNFKCDTVLIVICWNPDQIATCQRTICTGHPEFDLIPIVASRDSELCRGANEASAPYLVMFAGYIGAIDLDADTGRQAMEAKMAGTAYRNDFIEAFVEKGEAKGRAEGLATAILKTLRVREISVTPEQAGRIQACDDPGLLETWLDAAFTAKTTEEIFGG